MYVFFCGNGHITPNPNNPCPCGDEARYETWDVVDMPGLLKEFPIIGNSFGMDVHEISVIVEDEDDC